jgi:hypothetical protein
VLRRQFVRRATVEVVIVGGRETTHAQITVRPTSVGMAERRRGR